MDLAVSTQKLEELAEERQLSEDEKIVLNEKNSPDFLFKRFGKPKLAGIIREMRSKYKNDGDKEYIKKLILRLVGKDSDLNWSTKEYLLQQSVSCPVGQNKVIVVHITKTLNADSINSSRIPELKLSCALHKSRYIKLTDIVDQCCFDPRQYCSYFIKYITDLKYEGEAKH